MNSQSLQRFHLKLCQYTGTIHQSTSDLRKEFSQLANNYKHDVEKKTTKYKQLQDLDMFVLDNSIRESSIGQLRGHTLESKWAIYDEVKKCGFQHIIVGLLSHMTQVDDIFIKQLVERGEERDDLWVFSEINFGKFFITFDRGGDTSKKCTKIRTL